MAFDGLRPEAGVADEVDLPDVCDADPVIGEGFGVGPLPKSRSGGRIETSPCDDAEAGRG